MKYKNIILLLFISLFVLIVSSAEGGGGVDNTNTDTDTNSEDNKETSDTIIITHTSSEESPNSESSTEVKPSQTTKPLVPSSQSLVNNEDKAPEESSNNESYNNELKCNQTHPTKNIIEDCTENKIDEKICCYMKIEFKESTQYSCIPVTKEGEKAKSEDLKEKIRILKQGNNEYKSINIDCSFKLIKFNFILIYLLLLFLLQ